MYSQLITVENEEVLLLVVPPNWSQPVRVVIRMDTAVAESVTGMQERSAEHFLPRIQMEYSVTLAGGQLQQLRSVLGGLQGRRVAIPFWPDVLNTVAAAHAAGGEATDMTKRLLSGRLNVGWEPGYTAVTTASDPGTLDRAYRGALLVGRLGQKTFQALTDDLASYTIAFTEEAPPEVAAEAAANAPVQWQPHWHYNWQRLPEQSQRVLTERSYLGRGREPVMEGSAEVRLWQQSAQLTLETEDLAEFVAFYCARRGALEAFELPGAIEAGIATTTAPHRFDASNGRVRFSDKELRMDFITARLADISFRVEQQLESVEPQVSDSYAFLYQLRYEGATQRLTDWESPVEALEATWTPARIEHGRIRQSLRPQNEECEIKVAIEDAPILQPLLRLELESSVGIEIHEVNLRTLTARMLFTGVVQSARAKGQSMNLKAAAFGGALDRKVPRFQFSITCNHTLFSHGCVRRRPGQMAKSARMYSGIIAYQWDANAPRVILESFTAPAQRPSNLDQLDGWFSGGWLEVFWDSGLRQVREITWSGRHTVENDPDRLYLSMYRVLRDISAGTPVRFFAGCDGSYSTCRNKFGNGVNFGGFPFMPDYIEQAPSGMPKGGK
jgi:uncharacterized phage protein (TIGR02218 family)